jgi:hypothetical protein
VGVAHRGVGGGQQRLRPVEQQVGVARGDEVRVVDPELPAQSIDLRVLGAGSDSSGRPPELEVGAETLDVVEVDAHAVPDQ